jgi:hypothetical protein
MVRGEITFRKQSELAAQHNLHLLRRTDGDEDRSTGARLEPEGNAHGSGRRRTLELKGWASPAQSENELFGRDFRLTENTRESAGLEFTVHWQHAPLGLALHDDVAAALANLLKTQTFEGALSLSP